MRRNSLCALLFVLALAVQAVTPAAARMAMGAGSASPMCLTASAAGASVDETQPAGRPHPAPEICDLCALCCAAGASLVDGPRCAVGGALVPGVVVSWAVADAPTVPLRRHHAIRARAPPAFS
ncbi:hypothetical protein [Methylosinus sp. Sm6]|uniref:hypothetical protein n=1 Tax=Methylosinus sp. Sm6 TaxID=2866948 RepID=UPI001C992C0E|nr:hypothetical protein [Methylosinus sp. Sm6]MBY6243980.1 hypothetical protein [Methylosinus sp. Sm6]